MVIVAPFVRLETKLGKEPEVEKFLECGLAFVEGEPATTAWFALRLGPSRFGIFDAFPNEGGRQAHRSGRLQEGTHEHNRPKSRLRGNVPLPTRSC